MRDVRVEGKSANPQIHQVRELIRACPHKGLVFFGGAGVSTESGIPDFRSASGLYAQYEKNPAASPYPYPPEVMVSHSFFEQHPAQFYDFYCERMLALDAKPNAAHIKLAELEEEGVCRAVITQNIDGLHQKAGSKRVLELHGSVYRNHCVQCEKFYSVEELLSLRDAAQDGVPRCTVCGGIIKPDVVLYEEPLDQDVMQASVEALAAAKLLIVAGTSLSVYPAAGLIQYFSGDNLVIINQDPTPADSMADIVVNESVGKVFSF